MNYKKSTATICVIIFITLISFNHAFAGASGADLKGYIPASPGVKALLFYNHYFAADETYLNDDKNPAYDDYKLDVTSWVFRPINYFQVGSFTGSIQALIPFTETSMDATIKSSDGPVSISTSHFGLVDPTILGGVWLVNRPESQTWLGVSEWINLPVGDYDNSRILTGPGDNRWGFKTEVGFVKGFGNFYVEFVPSIEFFTDNDDHMLRGGSIVTCDKDPVYRLDAHFIYDIVPKTTPVSLSLDYYYAKGGEESFYGTERNVEMDDHALQLTLGLGLTPTQKILIQYREDIEVENGSKGSRIGIRYTYAIPPKS